MERLSKRSETSNMVWFKDRENGNMRLEPCEMTAHHSRMAIEKLAAYEDLGYTPEELKLCFDPPEILYEFGPEIDGERVHPIYPVDGQQVEFLKGNVYWNCINDFGNVIKIPLSGLHEEYFLTREETEAKLKEMEGESDVL